jgi:hypothetical protein
VLGRELRGVVFVFFYLGRGFFLRFFVWLGWSFKCDIHCFFLFRTAVFFVFFLHEISIFYYYSWRSIDGFLMRWQGSGFVRGEGRGFFIFHSSSRKST